MRLPTIKYFYYNEYCLYDALHGFSVWLRTSLNPADSNRFRSYNRKSIKNLCIHAGSFYEKKIFSIMFSRYGINNQ